MLAIMKVLVLNDKNFTITTVLANSCANAVIGLGFAKLQILLRHN